MIERERELLVERSGVYVDASVEEACFAGRMEYVEAERMRGVRSLRDPIASEYVTWFASRLAGIARETEAIGYVPYYHPDDFAGGLIEPDGKRIDPDSIAHWLWECF